MAGSVQARFVPVHRKADGNRLDLPRKFTDRVEWLKGDDEIDGWLVAIDVGRYRLLSDEQAANDESLAPIRLFLTEGPSEDRADLNFGNDSEKTAKVASLIPIRAKLHKGEWRIAWPTDFDAFAPDDCDLAKFSMVVTPEGYCEIWYTDLLRNNGTVRLRRRRW